MLTTELLAELLPDVRGTQKERTAAVDAANAYVARYRGNDEWTADTLLGAAMLARGIIRDGYTPAIGEGWEQNASVFARLTDVRIEQLLRLGRFAPPKVG